jgi:DNA-binding MarR family transcriptional regulator
LGLTYAQYITMLYLWEHEEGTVGELCTALSLDTGTMSPLLKRLETSGMIERHRLPSDERTVMVHLTEKGRELEQKAISVPEHIAACLLSNDKSEQGRKYQALKEMLDETLTQLKESRNEREQGR